MEILVNYHISTHRKSDFCFLSNWMKYYRADSSIFIFDETKFNFVHIQSNQLPVMIYYE